VAAGGGGPRGPAHRVACVPDGARARVSGSALQPRARRTPDDPRRDVGFPPLSLDLSLRFRERLAAGLGGVRRAERNRSDRLRRTRRGGGAPSLEASASRSGGARGHSFGGRSEGEVLKGRSTRPTRTESGSRLSPTGVQDGTRYE